MSISDDRYVNNTVKIANHVKLQVNKENNGVQWYTEIKERCNDIMLELEMEIVKNKVYRNMIEVWTTDLKKMKSKWIQEVRAWDCLLL